MKTAKDHADRAVTALARLLPPGTDETKEIDGILLGHETYSLVRDEIAVEEREPIKVKGFADPIRCYKVLGLYDDLADEGMVIREEADGFKFLLDLQKRAGPRPSPRSSPSSRV